MSRMYYWAQAFMELYPNEMKVYYEDNKFICYKIEQNMYHQYDFAIDYRYNQNKMQDETAKIHRMRRSNRVKQRMKRSNRAMHPENRRQENRVWFQKENFSVL